ncbi:MAG: glycosyltransferase [Pirellula staleyi]
MDITVAICTWNRANLLAQTLARLESLEIPSDLSWELVVVNNCCTDDTDSVLADYESRLPIKRVFEEKAGHSNARNCAIDHALGELIVWTDDDVLVSPRWLVEYKEASRRYPDSQFFGGPIRPWFEGTPPGWLKPLISKYGYVYALRDFGNRSFCFDKLKIPFGANFAIRAETQRAFRYDPNRGRKRKGMMGTDETTVLHAILEAGGSGVWIPSACVDHFIPKSRQSIGYLFAFFRGCGQCEAMHETDGGAPMLFGKPRWLWRQTIDAAFRFYTSRFVSRSEVWCEQLEKFGCYCGHLSSRREDGASAGTEK